MGVSFAAFVSYSHRDDEYDEGAIRQLAERLERALRAFTGRADLAVFFDRQAIEWGDAWRVRIGEGVATSAALIPVVTPSYLASEECRREFEEFVSNWGKWFLPLYYMEVDDFDARQDPVSTAVRSAQYADWRELRETDNTSLAVRTSIEKLAKRIRDLLREASQADDVAGWLPVSEPTREFRAHTMGDDEGEDWLDLLIAARAAMDDEEYGLARAILLDALDSYSQPELVHQLAQVDWYDGALDEAVAEFEQALEGGIPRDDILHGLGQVRVELGDFERGVRELTEVIDGPGDHLSRAYARSSRALGLGGLGQFDEALQELQAAERVTPANAWLHFNRARLLDWQGDQSAAASYARSLVCDGPPLNRPKRRYAQERLRQLGWPG
jgi:hypothetical protein